MDPDPSIARGRSPSEMQERAERFAARLLSLYSGPNSKSLSQTKELLDELPRLTEDQVNQLGHKESVCPICFTSLLAILSEEEMAIAMDSPAHPIEELGVTRLAAEWQCGHIFCRRDISKWIVEGHDSCPTCRRPLLKPDPNARQTNVATSEADPDAQAAGLIDDIQGYIAALEEGGSSTPIRLNAAHSRPDDFFGMYS
ncbi:hypothetical protein HGRIS_009957 [Hohenbuehelia grisea]|uniref:RING-type domain-containing protein n=1 Tax=Hohenbuehelia grisea TaxID=104357 RepID=A0ABR3J3B0_9AGAR